MTIRGTIQDGQIVPDSAISWPNGTRIELHRLPVVAGNHLSDDDFDALVKELNDVFDEGGSPDVRPLSEHAVSREGIYGDRP